ncbi:MAG: hypothetical protein ACRCYQ_04280 [Nocardioides sp.]
MKYDPAKRPELVLGERRSKVLRALVGLIGLQALVAVGIFGYNAARLDDDAGKNAEALRTYLVGFAVPVTLLLLVVAVAAFSFIPRRNVTARMLVFFSAALLVMTATLLRGGLIGVGLTLYGLVVIALAYWPDKALRAEREGHEPGGLAHR